ncbi:protein of unknown function [Rhodovastum atsumiense]|nr:protein of unknown function [Rhodovastum atsumiense]
MHSSKIQQSVHRGLTNLNFLYLI